MASFGAVVLGRFAAALLAMTEGGGNARPVARRHAVRNNLPPPVIQEDDPADPPRIPRATGAPGAAIMVDKTLSSIVTGPNGRVSFSGLGSNIDFQKTVDAIVAAKRIPVDRLEAQITTNQDRIASFQEMRSHLTTLQNSLQNLYGAVTVDQSKNIFEAKQAFASSGRSDGQTASNPVNLIGVTVGNKAAVGKHTIEIIQTAASHRVGSGSFASASTDLGTARGQAAGSIQGTFDIGGVTIDVLPKIGRAHV